MAEQTPAKRGFIPPRDDGEKFLVKRCEELAALARRQSMPRYTGFLSDREQSLAEAAMNRAACREYRFEGGYEGAERKILCIEPEDSWQEQPVACVRIEPAAQAARLPAHKDYLGALLGLGMERECVGDILLTADGSCAYAFVQEAKQQFICNELFQVGSVTVRTSPCDDLAAGELPLPERTLKTASISSLRVDAFLAAAMNCSRTMAGEYIRAGRVEINHIPVQHAHEEIYEKDVFTVRGKGRFRLEKIGGKSRKDRTFVEYFQY